MVSDSKAGASGHLISAENTSDAGQLGKAKDEEETDRGSNSCFKRFGEDGRAERAKKRVWLRDL